MGVTHCDRIMSIVSRLRRDVEEGVTVFVPERGTRRFTTPWRGMTIALALHDGVVELDYIIGDGTHVVLLRSDAVPAKIADPMLGLWAEVTAEQNIRGLSAVYKLVTGEIIP